MAEWFRSWHGAPADPKWTVIARKANAPRAVVVALAWCLMDYASQESERGSVEGADPETLAVTLDVDEETVSAVLSAMREKERFITRDGRLAAWERRQPKTDDPTAAERMRRYRERQKAGAVPPASGDADPERSVDGQEEQGAKPDTVVTERNDRNRYTEQSRAEQSREERAARNALAATVGRRCLEILGNPVLQTGIVWQWLADGADPERDIYPAIQRGAGRSVRSLSYFTPAIAEAIKRRKADERQEGTTDLQRQLREKHFAETGEWLPGWGQRPTRDVA